MGTGRENVTIIHQRRNVYKSQKLISHPSLSAVQLVTFRWDQYCFDSKLSSRVLPIHLQ